MTEETRVKLLAHSEEFKSFGVTVEQHTTFRKVFGASDALGVALLFQDPLDPGVLSKLVIYLSSLDIPEEQIFRLRLDEPEQISRILEATMDNPSPGALEYYKEHLAHGRHTETQRSTAAGLTFALAGVIIGRLLEKPQLTRALLPYTVTLFVIGIFTLLLTAKLYERFKLHNSIAKKARNAYDPSLAEFRRQAELEHKEKFKNIYKMKLHIIWNAFFLLISALGLGWTLAIIIFGT